MLVLNIEHLHYFLTVVDCQSINKASNKLFLKQSYLSNLIKSLEKSFGTQLLNRTSKGITLTDDGEYLVDKIRLIVNTYEEILQSYLYPSKQELRYSKEQINLYTVPQVNSTSLTRYSQLFHEAFPHACLNIALKNIPDIIQSMYTNFSTIGLGMVFTTSFDKISLNFPDDIQSYLLQPIELVAVASPSNQDAQTYTKISCFELLEKDLIIFTTENNQKNSILYQVLSQFEEPNIKYSVENTNVFLDFLQTTSCYSLVNRQFAEEQNLLAIPLTENILCYSILFHHQNCLDSFLARNFIDILLSANQA